MNLKKMLLLVGMALALVAFAAPAAVQAHGLTENGEMLEDTAPVTLTSTNLKTETGLGTLTCAKVTLHYHVEHGGNNGTTLLLEPTPSVTNNATTETCRLNGSTVVHISPAGTHTVTMNTWGHGEVQSSFTGKITSVLGTITCTYTGKVTVQGVNGTSTVNVGPSVLTSSCGNGTMTGSFTAETPDGTPLVGDFQKTG